MGNSGNDRRIDNIELLSATSRARVSSMARPSAGPLRDYGSTYCEFSDGRLTGGFAKGDPMNPGGSLVILYADDLSKTQTCLEDAGARIVKPVFAFPGGRRFHFHDLDGYELAVWSDK